MFCTRWIPVDHVSWGYTEKQCFYMITPGQQLIQPGLSRKTLQCNKHSTGGIWIVLIQYRQAGSDGSFRAAYALYGTIQSGKICRQHQITKREHWLCSGTICYHSMLPEHVICQWESSRWTEALRSSFIEDKLCPEAVPVLLTMEFIHSVKKDLEALRKVKEVKGSVFKKVPVTLYRKQKYAKITPKVSSHASGMVKLSS